MRHQVNIPLKEIEGSLPLYCQIRGAFIQKGSSLNEWCKANGWNHAHTARCLKGVHNGPAAKRLRSQVFMEALE
jgi:hypothetical protein